MKYIYTLILLAAFSCKPKEAEKHIQEEATAEKVERTFPAPIASMLQAHGGYDTWEATKMIAYDLKKESDAGIGEHQSIDIHTRKVNILGEGYEIGFDGKDVWVAPNKKAYGGSSARFYHNLYFYFFALPFLSADPGIIYDDRGIQEMEGEKFSVVSITYNNGVGDSSEDEYILYLNPQTFELDRILYTVTYYSKEKSKKYNAIIYDAWTVINGLKLPTSFTGYVYADGKIGKVRYKADFKNLEVYNVLPNRDIFKRPEVSEIDSLK